MGEVVYYQLVHNVQHPETGNTVGQVIHQLWLSGLAESSGVSAPVLVDEPGLRLRGAGGGSREGVVKARRAAETRYLAEGVRRVESRRLGQELRDLFKKLDISMPKQVLAIQPLTPEV